MSSSRYPQLVHRCRVDAGTVHTKAAAAVVVMPFPFQRRRAPSMICRCSGVALPGVVRRWLREAACANVQLGITNFHRTHGIVEIEMRSAEELARRDGILEAFQESERIKPFRTLKGRLSHLQKAGNKRHKDVSVQLCHMMSLHIRRTEEGSYGDLRLQPANSTVCKPEIQHGSDDSYVLFTD